MPHTANTDIMINTIRYPESPLKESRIPPYTAYMKAPGRYPIKEALDMAEPVISRGTFTSSIGAKYTARILYTQALIQSVIVIPAIIPMLQYAGVGVAMDNAPDKVKFIADYVTERDNDHAGVTEVIERFFV